MRRLLCCLGSALPGWTVAAILLGAGLGKLGSSEPLARLLVASKVLPAPASQILLVVIPWWEIVVGLLLLLRLWEMPAAEFATLLFAGFAGFGLLVIYKGTHLECGCFGTFLRGGSPGEHLIFNIAGLLLSMASTWNAMKRASSSTPVGCPSQKASDPSDVVLPTRLHE